MGLRNHRVGGGLVGAFRHIEGGVGAGQYWIIKDVSSASVVRVPWSCKVVPQALAMRGIFSPNVSTSVRGRLPLLVELEAQRLARNSESAVGTSKKSIKCYTCFVDNRRQEGRARGR